MMPKQVKPGGTGALALRHPPEYYRALAADVYRTSETLAVDLVECKFGREALLAAAEAAEGAARQHQRKMSQSQRGRELAKAVEHLSAAADAFEQAGNLALISYFPDLRARIDEIASRIPWHFSPRDTGSPGRPVQLAAVQAVARVWSENVGRSIPRQRPQPGTLLHSLIAAVSQDIFGHPSVLSPSAISRAVNDKEVTAGS